MFKTKIRILFLISGLLIFTLPFLGGDCDSSNNPPAPSMGIAAPVNVSVVVTSDSTGNLSSADIHWDASPDENMSNFYGYRIITYKMDADNNYLSVFENENVPKVTHSFAVGPLGTGVKFQSFILSRLNDGSESDSVSTLIYAGVFYRTDGTIDEYQPGDTSVIKSGYGWNFQTGEGFNLYFNSDNTGLIDMNLRGGEDDSLTLYSPELFPPGTKRTRFIFIGRGQEAFDQTVLPEPVDDSVRVDSDDVILLKTQEGNYAKIWIKSIRFVAGSIPPFYNILFDYKVQPIGGFRVL